MKKFGICLVVSLFLFAGLLAGAAQAGVSDETKKQTKEMEESIRELEKNITDIHEKFQELEEIHSKLKEIKEKNEAS